MKKLIILVLVTAVVTTLAAIYPLFAFLTFILVFFGVAIYLKYK